MKPATAVGGRPVMQLDLHLPYQQVRLIRVGPALSDTLPPFPMCQALPDSEYYHGSAPPTPFGRRRTYPPTPPRPGGYRWNATQTVPTFTVIR